jgi:hypothetical protein
MVDFDLPTVQIGLHQMFQRTVQIGRQQISRVPVTESALLISSVGLGRYDHQAQRPSPIAPGLGFGPSVSSTLHPDEESFLPGKPGDSPDE